MACTWVMPRLTSQAIDNAKIAIIGSAIAVSAVTAPFSARRRTCPSTTASWVSSGRRGRQPHPAPSAGPGSEREQLPDRVEDELQQRLARFAGEELEQHGREADTAA